MFKITLFFSLLMIGHFAMPIELKPEKLQFTYLSTSNKVYTTCSSEKGNQPHQFKVNCKDINKQFNIHLMLREFSNINRNETLIEFHYWVDEKGDKLKSNTQSNWFTLDQISNLKKIISYTGLDNDIHQLKVEIKL